MAGVLCLPSEPSPYPAIVYIPGSGPTTRDGLGMLPQHWEACAGHGIASLSWDKAGVGDSTSEWTAQTMEDRAWEEFAAIRFLNQRTDIVTNKTCPVLALFGERDTLVDGTEIRRVYATALKKAGNPDVTIKTFPDTDHALFLSKTGGMKELQQSFLLPADQKIFAPGYLDLLAGWVQQHLDETGYLT